MTEVYMKEKWKMAKEMALVNSFMQMVDFMKEIGLIIKEKVLEYINGIMEISLKENGKMIKEMEKV